MKQTTTSPPRQDGYTLIEILVAVALLALLFVSLTAVIARSAQASRTSSVTSMNNTSVTKIGEQLGDDLSRGMNILRRASTTTLDFYRLGDRVPLQQPAGAERFGKKTITFLGSPLASLVGKPIIITNNRGKYISTQVISSTTSGSSSTVTFSCNLSLEGNLTAYPFKNLSFDGTSNLTRTENGNTTVVAQNVKYVKFEPMYHQSAGTFPTSSSAPLLQKGGHTLSAINYGVVGQGDPPVTSIGSARINLAALTPVDCNNNPATPANNLGKLQVNVLLDGQPTAPAGVNPNVSVSGPEPISNISTFSTRVYERMSAGSYSANAPIITSGTTIYDPIVTNNPGLIGNGRQATINVNYKIRKGKLQLQIVGLPNPLPGSGTVTVSGPDPKSITATNGTTPLELTPGNYTITATSVGGYVPTVSQPSLNVTSSTNTTVTVTYTDPSAPLTLRVNGLPAGTIATLTASGPESRTIDVPTGSSVTTSLKKGTYTISAPAKTVSGLLYTATPAIGNVTLGSGGATHVVTYNAPPPVTPPGLTPPGVTPPGLTPPGVVPPVTSGMVRFKIGAAPPNGKYYVTSYEVQNGKLKFLKQDNLNEYTSYDLPDNYYYIFALSAPSTTNEISHECDVFSPTDPFASCATAKHGDSVNTETVSRQLDWSLASDNQPSNIGTQATTSQNTLAYQYKTGTTTNFFGSGCSKIITERRHGPVGNVKPDPTVTENLGCSAYNPINISSAEVASLMDAIVKAVPDVPNLNTFIIHPEYDFTPTYMPLFTAFKVSGLTQTQQSLFGKLSYYVEKHINSKSWNLYIIGCSAEEFKVCPNDRY